MVLLHKHLTGSMVGIMAATEPRTMPATIGFRPDATDWRILQASDEGPTMTIRRALRLLDHERWLKQFYIDAERLKDENLGNDPDEW